jgi:thiamine pyrophosphokinase
MGGRLDKIVHAVSQLLLSNKYTEVCIIDNYYGSLHTSLAAIDE